MEFSKCYYCGGNLIVTGEFSLEDLGIEEEGIVTNLICTHCGAVWEGTQIYEEAEE